MMAFPDNKYQGEGLYSLPLTDLIGLYVKQIDTSKREKLLQLISVPSKSKDQPAQAAKINQKKGTEDFLIY